MQTHAAVFRTGDVLKEGCDKMDSVYKSMDDIKTFDRGQRRLAQEKLNQLEIQFLQKTLTCTTAQKFGVTRIFKIRN